MNLKPELLASCDTRRKITLCATDPKSAIEHLQDSPRTVANCH